MVILVIAEPRVLLEGDAAEVSEKPFGTPVDSTPFFFACDLNVFGNRKYCVEGVVEDAVGFQKLG